MNKKIGSIEEARGYWMYIGRYYHDGKEFDLFLKSDNEDGFFTWNEAMQKFGDSLPTAKELHLIAANIHVVPNINKDRYWSSTECAGNYAWGQRFSDGLQTTTTKTYAYRVRCVRRSEVKYG